MEKNIKMFESYSHCYYVLQQIGLNPTNKKFRFAKFALFVLMQKPNYWNRVTIQHVLLQLFVVVEQLHQHRCHYHSHRFGNIYC